MEPNTEYLNYKVGNGSYHLHRENAEYIFIQLFLLMILNKKTIIKGSLVKENLLGDELIWHCPSFDTEK